MKAGLKLISQGVALLAPPVLLVAWLVSGVGVRWIAARSKDFNGSLFAANTLVLMLVWLGHVMTLINLGFYIWHVHQEAGKSGDAHDSSRRELMRVFVFSIVLAMVIAVFVTVTVIAFFGVQVPFVSFEWVVQVNHVVLLGVFGTFTWMDWRAWRIAKTMGARAARNASAATLSLWAISVPCLFITILALIVHHVLQHDPAWMIVFDKPGILSGEKYSYLHVPLVAPSPAERPMFSLFVSGLNVGLLMASIVASQMAFFVIQVFREGGGNWHARASKHRASTVQVQ